MDLFSSTQKSEVQNGGSGEKLQEHWHLKISLAVRKDVYSGEYDPSISRKLSKNVVEEIKKSNPFPKKSTKSKKIDDKETRKKRKEEINTRKISKIIIRILLINMNIIFSRF